MFSETPIPADIPNVSAQSEGANFASTSLSTTTTANSEERIEVTTFHDVETPEVALTAMAQNTSRIDTMDDTVSIVQFLRRPVKLDHIQISPGISILQKTATTTAQQPIISHDFPYAILDKGGKMPKVQNHQYFKASVRVKLVLNTNPFVLGRFYLTYSPYEKDIVKARQQQWASRAGVTAYPGVEIDAQLNNSVEMVIPFPSYKEAYVLTGEPENFVTLYLFAITDVAGTKDAKGILDISIFAWFENIELIMPTLKTSQDTRQAIPPTVAMVSQKDKTRLALARKLEKLKLERPDTYRQVLAWAQIKEVDLQVQAEAKEKGPIGEIAGAVGSIANIVKGVPIPIVSEIATGVSWISDIVGGIAGIFGWSRPNSYAQIAPLQNVPGKFYTHISAEDQSVSLALSQKNELTKPLNIFPSAVDEMDLAFVCANPAVKDVFRWNKAATLADSTTPIGLLPVGIGCFTSTVVPISGTATSLESEIDPVWGMVASNATWCPGNDDLNIRVRSKFLNAVSNDVFESGGKFSMQGCGDVVGKPACAAKTSFVTATGDLSVSVLDTAPCEYVSQIFQYWRATIVFKISVVKTAFHTGRLEIFFDPGMYYNKTSSIEPDLSKYKDVDTTNNHRYILDLTNETEITIRIPYVSEKVALKTSGYNTGSAHVPQPEDIAESIFGSLVIRPLTNLMAPETVADYVEVVVWKWAEDVALMAPVNAGNTDFAIYGVTESKTPEVKVAFADLPLSTIKQMKYVKPTAAIERSVQLQINIGNVAAGNTITLFPSTRIDQNNMEACGNVAGERIVNLRCLLRCFRDWHEYTKRTWLTFNLQDESSTIDYMSYLSYMYRFFRGGVRYKAITDSKSVKSWLHPTMTKATNQAPTHITFGTLNPVHEVNIPYYSQYRKLPISGKDGLLNVTFKFDEESDVQMLRAGNDDLTYGWLMGTPQLMAGPVSVNWKTYTRTKVGTVRYSQVGSFQLVDYSCLHPLGSGGCTTQPEVKVENIIPNPYAAPYRGKRETEGHDIPDNWQGISRQVDLQIDNQDRKSDFTKIENDMDIIYDSGYKEQLDVRRTIEKIQSQLNDVLDELFPYHNEPEIQKIYGDVEILKNELTQFQTDTRSRVGVLLGKVHRVRDAVKAADSEA